MHSYTSIAVGTDGSPTSKRAPVDVMLVDTSRA